jgi:hypothetical protein
MKALYGPTRIIRALLFQNIPYSILADQRAPAVGIMTL